MKSVEEQAAALRDLLRTYGRVAVAFSGGVDSALLVSVAADELAADVLALIADIATVPREEIAAAQAFCEEHAIAYETVVLDVLPLDAIRNNKTDRCYVCKMAMMTSLLDVARTRGFDVLVDGSNADDERAHRPGMRVLEELGIASPLRDVGIGKTDVRALAQVRGLRVWDKPSTPCLATRFPMGERLDLAHLQMVEQAESIVRETGCATCRVRVYEQGTMACIEVPEHDIVRLTSDEIRLHLVEALLALGFKHVVVDLAGYRSGSMEAL